MINATRKRKVTARLVAAEKASESEQMRHIARGIGGVARMKLRDAQIRMKRF